MKYDIAHLTEARPSRRAVTRAAAWSVPVIAVATSAPAFAASCQPVRATIGNATGYNRVSSTEWNATFDVDGNGPLPANVLTAKASYDPGMGVRNDNNGGANDNFTIQNQVGGLGTFGLVMAQRPTASTPTAPLSALGHYTFSFSKPVTNLSFTLTDIDSATNDFWDSVWLSAGFTYKERGTGMQGIGTPGNPFKQSSGNTPVDNATGANGNVTITYPGTISSFTINYSNAQTAFSNRIDQDQVVTIANFAFDFQPC